MSVNNEKSSLLGGCKVDWNISNKSTRVWRNLAAGAAITAALAVIVMAVAAHNLPSQIGSCTALGAGGAAVVTGIVYGGCKIRDWKEKKRAAEDWENNTKGEIAQKMGGLGENEQLTTTNVKLDRKMYRVKLIKKGNKVKISSEK